MAVHSGFFNSSNSDRKYNAEHFSRFFDGLICDGVYVNYPEKDDNGNYTDATARGFYVSPGSGIAVNVARGRCFFDGYWMYTDAVTVINLSSLVPSNSLSKKLVAIFIDVDTSLEGREVKFVAVAGNEVANDDQHVADPPTPANTQSHKQYPIALIAMNGTVSAISASNIYRFDTLYGDTDYRKAYFAKTTSVEALLEYSSRTKSEIDQRISKIEAPTFTEASTLANINSGENINTLWGKIKKVFTDLIFNPGSGNAKKAWIVGSDGKGSFKSIKDTFDSDALFSRSAPGIVPTAPSGSGTDKFLREDGSWFAPVGTNTNAQTVGNVEIAYNNGYPSYKYNGAWRRFKDPTGTASAGDVLSGKTFANAASDTLVTGTFASQEKTITASRSQQIVTPDSGKWLSKVTVNKYPDANGTYPANSRGSALDMGWNNNYRYVNTNNVPNYNNGRRELTKNEAYDDVDLGESNNIRYVNARQIWDYYRTEGWNEGYSSGYNQGKTDGYNSGYNAGRAQGQADWHPYNYIMRVDVTQSTADTCLVVLDIYQNGYEHQRYHGYGTVKPNITGQTAWQTVWYAEVAYGDGVRTR